MFQSVTSIWVHVADGMQNTTKGYGRKPSQPPLSIDVRNPRTQLTFYLLLLANHPTESDVDGHVLACRGKAHMAQHTCHCLRAESDTFFQMMYIMFCVGWLYSTSGYLASRLKGLLCGLVGQSDLAHVHLLFPWTLNTRTANLELPYMLTVLGTLQTFPPGYSQHCMQSAEKFPKRQSTL